MAQVVNVDPSTGRFLPPAPTPPAGAQQAPLSPVEQNARSTSTDGLVEVPNPKPGGGVKLDLQGRFQSPLTATIGPDGKARVQHAPPAPNDAR